LRLTRVAFGSSRAWLGSGGHELRLLLQPHGFEGRVPAEERAVLTHQSIAEIREDVSCLLSDRDTGSGRPADKLGEHQHAIAHGPDLMDIDGEVPKLSVWVLWNAMTASRPRYSGSSTQFGSG